MKNVYNNIVECVGNTPLVRLNSVTSEFKATVWAKVEYMNPGTSVKDRIAIQIIKDAEEQGLIEPGGTIVEGTSGNTGAGLAMVAAIKGYKCIFVLPDKQSEEKRANLRAYGAKVVVTPTDVLPEDPRSYYRVSERLVEETENSFYANQYHNPSNPKTHYETTGPELHDQLDGKIDVFVAGMGTGGTITGVGKYLKERSDKVQIVGVDPVGSLYYDYFKTGQLTEAFTYVLEGIGEDFLPSTMDFEYVDDVIRVNDRECFEMTRRIAREEGIMAGASSGAAVIGAIKYLREHDREGLNVVVLLPDHGSKYMSKVFNDMWMEENGFLSAVRSLGVVSDVLAGLNQKGVTSIGKDKSVGDTIELMKRHGFSQMPVMDGDKVVGVIHERALLEHALSGATGEPVGELAGHDFCVVSLNTEVSVTTDLLRRARIALVMKEHDLIGVLTRIDIIDHVARCTSA